MLRTNKFFYDNGFTVEIAVTPRCNLACPYCENRIQESYSCSDLDLDTAADFILRSFLGKKLTVILNGGEPTLNHKLKKFCLNLSKYKDITIILYTNLQAEPELYRELSVSGVVIKPTFHSGDPLWFRSKLTVSGIDAAVLIPCSDDSISNMDTLKNIFKNIELVLLENKNYSLNEIIMLSKIDKRIIDQFTVLKKAGNKKDTVRRCGSRYIYIDENGDVCQCVFLLQQRALGNIFDSSYAYKDLGEFMCPYGKCFYDI